MTELFIYIQYLGKIIVNAKTLVTTKTGIMVLLPTISYYAIADDLINAWKLLGIVFIIDFVTGIYASFIGNRNKKKGKGELESGFLKKCLLFIETVTSEKLRNSVVKAIGYILFIMLIYGTEKVFLIKSFNFFNISDKNWTITLVALGFCTAIEIYSIIFENIKRAGYDIAGAFVKILTRYKTIKKEIEDI
jgi:hypothetical protein